jgi:hypothetical protein
LGRAIGSDWKGKFSLAAYQAAMAITFVSPVVAVTLTAIVALTWLVPDRRIEAALAKEDQPPTTRDHLAIELDEEAM